MELTSHLGIEKLYRASSVIGAADGMICVMTPDVTIKHARLPCRPGSKINFSHPRPGSRSPHREFSESWSSLGSPSSVPSLTDASDSEISVEDDLRYNASANELWNTFWPDTSVATRSSEDSVRDSTTLPIDARDYHRFAAWASQTEEIEYGIVTAPTPSGRVSVSPRVSLSTSRPQGQQQQTARPPSRHLAPRDGPAAQPRSVPRPPRATSPLARGPPPVALNRSLKTHSSMANLRDSSKMAGVLEAPRPSPQVPTISVTRPPVSHAKSYSAPQIRRQSQLRACASAADIREQYNPKTQINATAPLSPIVQGFRSESRPTRHQMGGFVSVFEYDTDEDEDEAGTASSRLAKRLAQGLQIRKTTSDKRKAPVKRHAGSSASSLDLFRAVEDDGSVRKRGSSLSRLFGGKAW